MKSLNLNHILGPPARQTAEVLNQFALKLAYRRTERLEVALDSKPVKHRSDRRLNELVQLT